MVKHIVFFKFRADASSADRSIAAETLRKLPSQIDFIRDFEIGEDVLHSPRSWDLVLVATYDDLDSLKRYAEHPDHLPVIDLMKSVCESIGSVDYVI
jgi:hypothetical protein